MEVVYENDIFKVQNRSIKTTYVQNFSDKV